MNPPAKDITETLKTLGHITTQMDMMKNVAMKTYRYGEEMDSFIQMEGWNASRKYSELLQTINLNYLVVFANSYLDEFNRYFNPTCYPEYADNILAFRRVIAPALRRIKKWKHLKEYRNELLVHNYRVKDKSVFATDHQPQVYNAPSKDQEILLLVDLIILINMQLLPFFTDETNRLITSREKLTDRYKTKSDPVDYRKDIAEITREVEELKKKELEKRTI